MAFCYSYFAVMKNEINIIKTARQHNWCLASAYGVRVIDIISVPFRRKFWSHELINGVVM